MSAPLSADLAQIGKSVVIKGDLSGSEDLYVDGQVEGTIALKGNSLTVGPHGQVKASVEAKGVVVQGKLEGNVQASDRVDCASLPWLPATFRRSGFPSRKAPT
jgi:cytoskeletal protein CcmA (bactofilin family)